MRLKVADGVNDESKASGELGVDGWFLAHRQGKITFAPDWLTRCNKHETYGSSYDDLKKFK